ncbi:MAG: hypothetical protein EAZ30_07240 [Betaproteobacteria bacterium]|nr:MAG: hypothetical protein EAZ30_07240 [Betaproteobacteria bacterium]
MSDQKLSRINYVLVDHENVSLSDADLLTSAAIRLIVFVGQGQKKISIDSAIAVQRLGTNAEYVQMSGTGPNSLDFHIAFYLGRLAEQNQTGFFHIVSKDKGFDPLIAHLKAQKLSAARSESISALPFARSRSITGAADRAMAFSEQLLKPKATKPSKRKTLTSAIAAFFSNALTDAEIEAVVASLESMNSLSFDGEKTRWSIV